MEQDKCIEYPSNYSEAQISPYQPKDDEIDLRELFSVLWRGKWVVIATTVVFAVISVLFALSQPNIYKADTLLASSESSSSGLSKMAGELGGLAALAGVNISGGASSEADLAVEVMKSRQFVEMFIKKHELLVPLMASKSWDLESDSLVLDEDLYDQTNNVWLREPEGLRGSMPTAQEAYKYFSESVLSITKNKETGLYTLSVMHFSPTLAKQWVNWLVEDINNVMRERAITETRQNLDYLHNQLEKTALADMQSTFYRLIEEQTKSLMLAEVRKEFIFKVVDPAVVPEQKSKPKRALICILGTLLGGMLGVALVLVRFSLKK